MADRPQMFECTRGFSEMADSMAPCKTLCGWPLLPWQRIWSRRRVQSPTGLCCVVYMYVLHIFKQMKPGFCTRILHVELKVRSVCVVISFCKINLTVSTYGLCLVWFNHIVLLFCFTAFMLLVDRQKEHLACKVYHFISLSIIRELCATATS